VADFHALQAAATAGEIDVATDAWHVVAN